MRNIVMLFFKQYRKSGKGLGATMRIIRVKLAALIGTAVFLSLVCLHLWLPAWNHIPTLEELEKEDAGMNLACRHPDLDPYNEAIAKHVQDLGELTCRKEPNWLITKKGYIHTNPHTVKKHGKVTCRLTYLIRVDDFNIIKSKEMIISSATGPAKLEEDFFVAKCTAEDRHTWKNVMAGVKRNETAVRRAKAIEPGQDSMKLNVMMFGLDSMSRLHYIRKLPKTYKYLTQQLNATVLTGYNIVGDGTPQALIPILTAKTEQELPETRKRMSDANHVNIYPFIWNNFTAAGYVSAYGEDSPYTGTFTYRLMGFKEMPTDHYMRTYYLEIEKVMKNHPRLCMANTPRHKVMLDWLRQFYDVYSDVPKFAFLFHSELSHDDYNLIGYADGDMEQFLKGLHDDGILNTTLLVMMSDHGHRFASIRETQQGKQEERMPFFSFILPPWLEKKYPDFVRNLRLNSNRLVTPFDIYSTLATILNPNIPKLGDVSSRSISLFSEIPKERTCKSADIEPHWCACLSWAQLPPTDPISRKAGQAVIDFINALTLHQRELCTPLILDEVTRSEKLLPNKALLKFRKNADKDGFVGEFSDDTKVTEILYQVQIRAYPSQGMYEASMKYNVPKDTFHIREQDISRINMYANQEHCVHDTFPNLRKYCYCKIQL